MLNVVTMLRIYMALQIHLDLKSCILENIPGDCFFDCYIRMFHAFVTRCTQVQCTHWYTYTNIHTHGYAHINALDALCSNIVDIIFQAVVVHFTFCKAQTYMKGLVLCDPSR